MLELKIKRVFLEQIISGEKKEEYREPSDFNMSRLFRLDHEQKMFYDKGIDKIKFVAGYAKDADWATVKVKKIDLYTFVHNIPEGFNKGDESIIIDLDEVLDYKLTEKKPKSRISAA